MSTAANLSVGNLQVWQQALTRAGASAESSNTSLARLATNVARAAQGDKALAEAFHLLDVEVKNLDGSLKTTDEVLNQLLNNISPENVQRYLPQLQRLFGDDAVRAWSIALSQGRSDFDALADSIVRIDENQANKLASLNASFAGIKQSLDATFASIVANFADEFQFSC